MQRAARMKRELEILQESPPHGISCWTKDESIELLEAQILGGEGTPYEGGIFKLDIQIPERYPFEPPKVRFLTPIYHPNIDNAGRICLDSLKMPPKGAWRPATNLSTLLTSIQLLMAEPNPDDPLMTDIAEEFKFNRPLYIQHARERTLAHAMSDTKGKENISANANTRSISDSEGSQSSDSEEDDDEDDEFSSLIPVPKKRSSDECLDSAKAKLLKR